MLQSIVLCSTIVLLLVYGQVSAQCDGTIGWRDAEGRFGVVALNRSTPSASPVLFRADRCTNTFYARGSEFCCALNESLTLWCFDWTRTNFAAADEWAVPIYASVWPPSGLAMGSNYNNTDKDELIISMIFRNAGTTGSWFTRPGTKFSNDSSLVFVLTRLDPQVARRTPEISID